MPRLLLRADLGMRMTPRMLVSDLRMRLCLGLGLSLRMDVAL